VTEGEGESKKLEKSRDVIYGRPHFQNTDFCNYSKTETRKNVIVTVMSYIQKAFCKADGTTGEYRGGTVKFIDATAPKQNLGTQDCGAFVIYNAIKILMVINVRCFRCVLCIHCAFFPHFFYSLFWGTYPTL
jgi:hypothetical protein